MKKIEKLETKIKELLVVLHKFKEENKENKFKLENVDNNLALKIKENRWLLKENSDLKEKNNKARQNLKVLIDKIDKFEVS